MALVEAAADLGVVRTVDVAPYVDADPVTLMQDDLDSLINVTLIAVALRTATTAKPNMTN